MTATHFFALVLLLLLLLAWGLFYILANSPSTGRVPAEPARRERSRLLTRALFVFWVAFLAAHRAWMLFLMAGLESSASSDAKGAMGMSLIFLDPWGLWPTIFGLVAFKNLTGTDLWPESGLGTFMMGISLVIDAALVYCLWLAARHAFRKPAPEESKS